MIVQLAASAATLVFIVVHDHLRTTQLTELKELILELSSEVSEIADKIDDEGGGYAGSLGTWKDPGSTE